MKRNEYLIVVALIAAIAGVSIYSYLQKPAVTQGVISAFQLQELRYTDNGQILSGYWVATCVVNSRTETIFTIRPENVSENLPTDSTNNIPPGSQLLARRGITVILKPLGDPYITGSVKQKGFAYNDGTGTTRVWEYYDLADPQWDVTGLHAPYEVTVQDWQTGQLITHRTFCAGIQAGWDSGDTIDLGSGIQLRQLGQLINGLVPPTSRWAYYYTEGGYPRFVPEADLARQFWNNLPGARRTNINISTMTYDHETSERTIASDKMSWSFDHGGYLGTWCTASLSIEGIYDDHVTLGFNCDQGQLFTDVWFYTNFQITSTAAGFDPEWVNMVVTNSWGGCGYSVSNVTNHQFTLTIHAGDPGAATINLYFTGAADTWSEVVNETGIQSMRSYDNELAYYFGSPQMVPSGVTVFSGQNTLYREVVPTAAGSPYGPVSPGSNPSLNTGMTAIRMLPGSSVQALVQIVAPVSLFDSIISRPPYGKPEIQGKVGGAVTGVTSGANQTSRWSITVKNTGMTGDTFVPNLYPPSNWRVVESPGWPYIEAGQTKTLSWTIETGQVEQAQTGTATVVVVAQGSGLSDTATSQWTANPVAPPIEYGDLEVTVIDDTTSQPISGASASCGGINGTTGSDGITTLKGIRTGPQKLVVGADGYDEQSFSLDIVKGASNWRTVRLVKSTKPSWASWAKWAIIGAIIAIFAGGAIWYYRKRRMRKG
jgi:hypothetical protein